MRCDGFAYLVGLRPPGFIDGVIGAGPLVPEIRRTLMFACHVVAPNGLTRTYVVVRRRFPTGAGRFPSAPRLRHRTSPSVYRRRCDGACISCRNPARPPAAPP